MVFIFVRLSIPERTGFFEVFVALTFARCLTLVKIFEKVLHLQRMTADCGLTLAK